MMRSRTRAKPSSTPTQLAIQLDLSARVPLSDQIHRAITTAITSDVLTPGARLPSWIDLASQLGVARGTVRRAYEKLLDAGMVVASRASGTRVAPRRQEPSPSQQPTSQPAFMMQYRELAAGNLMFKMGVPAPDCFPAKLFARIRARSIRAEAGLSANHPDRRGEAELKREIAVHLALARGLECSPDQIVITSGFAAGLALTLLALGLEGKKAWMEDPGFPLNRRALELGRLRLVPVPVDEKGLVVEAGLAVAPDAALALVTPGQQAPTGWTLSADRRAALLDWAARTGAFIIEDDYLSELQLNGRAAPALASLDQAGSVIHIGSFSKTLSPTLRLGFLVAPPRLAQRFAECAACLIPAPGNSIQLAMAEFMRDGHYMRHLRRTKLTYAARAHALMDAFHARGREVRQAGLAVILPLHQGFDDVGLAREALRYGLAPVPLSPWQMAPADAPPGLLLGVATAPQDRLDAACERLLELIERRP